MGLFSFGDSFNKVNKTEQFPAAANIEGDNENEMGPKFNLSQEVADKLHSLKQKLFDVYEDMEASWKTAGVLLGAAGVMMSSEAMAGGSVTQEQVKSAIISLENMKGLNAEQIMSYEDIVSEYAKEYGEGFKVKGDGVSFGRKLNFGDNLGVRVYYKDDSLTSKPEGIALNVREVVDKRVRDKIIIDGNVALRTEEGIINGNTMDGIVDKVVSRVDGQIVATYYYEHKVNPETGRVEISTETDRLNSDGKGYTRMKIGGGDKSFISVSEYMYHASQEAAKAATIAGATAQGEIPSVTF